MRRRRKARRHIPAKYVLWFLSILCVAAMFASFLFDVPFTPLNTAAGYVFIPMQKGINEIGTWAGGVTDNLAKLRDAGFQAEAVVKGLGEYPQFRKIYIDKLLELL